MKMYFHKAVKVVYHKKQN